MATLTYRGVEIEVLRVLHGNRRLNDANPNKCVDIIDVYVVGRIKNQTDEQLREIRNKLLKPRGNLSLKLDGKEIINKNLRDGCTEPKRVVLRKANQNTTIVEFDVQARDD